MKIKKIGILKGRKLCLSEMSAVAQVILALDKARSSTAPAIEGSVEFQRRCSDAVIALANTNRKIEDANVRDVEEAGE